MITKGQTPEKHRKLQKSRDVPLDVIPFKHSKADCACTGSKKHRRHKSCLSLKSSDRSHVFPCSFLLLFNQRARRGASAMTYDFAGARMWPQSRVHVEVNSYLVEQRTVSGGSGRRTVGSIH